MALTEAEERLVWRFLDYIRTAGMAVCVLASAGDIVAPPSKHKQWWPLTGSGRGLLEGFGAYLEQDQSSVVSRQSSEEQEGA